MRKSIVTLIISISTLVIIALGIGFYLFNKPHKDYVKAPPEFILDAQKLSEEFNTDELAANNKYLNRVIQVEGVIKDYRQNFNSDISIFLEDQMFGVTCTIDSSEVVRINKLDKLLIIGDSITIKGRCDGMLTDVRLSKCTIISD